MSARKPLPNNHSSRPDHAPMFLRTKNSELMKNWMTCLTFGAAVAVATAASRPPEAPQEAGVNLACRSIRLGQGTSKSDLSVVFSTAGAGARSFGNGELRPSVARPGFYEAGYVILDSGSGTPRRVETGTVFVAIPELDGDGDTVPDPADFSAPVEMALSAEAVPNAASLNTRVSQPNFTLRLLREGYSELGEFGTDLIADADLSGEYEVLHAEGPVIYRRTETGALLDFALSNATTNASTTARVLDVDTVRTAAFRLKVSPTRRVRVSPAVLSRVEDLRTLLEKGRREASAYRGEVSFSDGWDETAVSDFRSWVMEISDPNDRNENGIANFSDTLLPYIAVQPRRVIATTGSTVSFSVTVLGAGPFTFNWQQNGHELFNSAVDAGSRVLTLPNVTPEDAGSYRVYISNAAGTVVSESTSLSVRPASGEEVVK